MPGDADNAILWLMVIATPLLALLIYAALNYRPPALPRPRDDRSAPNWKAALFALGALLALTVAMALVARLLRSEPRRIVVRPPATTGPDGTRTPQQPPRDVPRPGQGDVNLELVTIFVLAAMLALLVTAIIVNRRRQYLAEPEPEDEPTARAGSPLEVATREALAAVDERATDPRGAIIRCYTAMERALADAPQAAPTPADTPSDVLQRAIEAGVIRTEAGAALVDLFTEARYSAHPMTEDDRAAAATALRTILQDLKGRAWIHS